MEMMTHQQADREAQLVHAHREELVERIGRTMRQDGSAQPLQGLHLYRHSFPLEQVYSVVEPSLCVVAQGSKEFLLGESRYRYDPLHYLLSHYGRSALRRSGPLRLEGAALPQSAPATRPHPRR